MKSELQNQGSFIEANKGKEVDMSVIKEKNSRSGYDSGRTVSGADCELRFGSVFQLLIAVVLSAQTTDKSVNQVTETLFRNYPDAQSIAAINEDELQQIIKRIGMYKTKSKKCIESFAYINGRISR